MGGAVNGHSWRPTPAMGLGKPGGSLIEATAHPGSMRAGLEQAIRREIGRQGGLKGALNVSALVLAVEVECMRHIPAPSDGLGR